MHYTNIIISLAIVAVCIVSRCNLVEGRFLYRQAIDRAAVTTATLVAARANLEGASQEQLDQFKKDLPVCLAKNDATFNSIVGPTISILSTVTGRKKRSLFYDRRSEFDMNGENDDAYENFERRDRAADVNTVLGLIGKVLERLKDKDLMTVFTITDTVVMNSVFMRGPYLYALVETGKTCASAKNIRRRFEYEDFEFDNDEYN